MQRRFQWALSFQGPSLLKTMSVTQSRTTGRILTAPNTRKWAVTNSIKVLISNHIVVKKELMQMGTEGSRALPSTI